MEFMEKCERLAKILGEQLHADYTASAKSTYNRRDFKSFDGKTPDEMLEIWEQNIGSEIKAVVIPGKKYTKIDVCLPQQSGRYMVVNETGEIFGIKAYGVIHKGHQYGTLDTIDQYYWGDYTARKLRGGVN